MENDAAGAPTELVADGVLASDVATYTALRTSVFAFRSPVAPELVAGGGPRPTVSIGELAEAGALIVLESPPTLVAIASGAPMLTAKDIRLGREPSRNGDPGTPGAVLGQPGDVVVVAGGGHVVVSVRTDAALLAPGFAVLRANPDVIDAHFLSGVVRAAADAADSRPIDLFGVAFPRVPIGEQRTVGEAVVQLMEIEKAWRGQRLAVERMVRDGLSGLSSGTLRIADGAGNAGGAHGE